MSCPSISLNCAECKALRYHVRRHHCYFSATMKDWQAHKCRRRRLMKVESIVDQHFALFWVKHRLLLPWRWKTRGSCISWRGLTLQIEALSVLEDSCTLLSPHTGLIWVSEQKNTSQMWALLELIRMSGELEIHAREPAHPIKISVPVLQTHHCFTSLVSYIDQSV